MTSTPGSSPHPLQAPQAAADATPPDILLVDDNEQNLELLHAYLEGMGATLRTAKDGLEALRLIDARKPDVILLDVMMPRMSGYQLCSRLKSEAGTKGIGVIMVTALNEISDVERATDCGADDFLTKPVTKLELIARVQNFLTNRRR